MIIGIERCEVCRVYSFIGPIFCPTRGRPRTDVLLLPGTYRVRASVDDPAIPAYAGEWPLEANTRYFLCFYILRTWGTSELTVRPEPGCPVERSSENRSRQLRADGPRLKRALVLACFL